MQSDFTDRQVPVGHETFIDHTAHFTAGLDDAAASLERLGFAVSTTNLQKNRGPDGVERPSGTSNRLVRLRRGFLEFLAATHDTPLADQLNAGLARYPGLHLIAFSNADLGRERARMVDAGFAMQELLEMRRKASEPGVEGVVGWEILRTEHGQMAEGRMQFVYPQTPELSWPPGVEVQPNAADALTGVLLVTADVDEALARYERFLGQAPVGAVFRTARGRLCIVAPENDVLPAEFVPPDLPFIAAVSIASRDMAQTRKALAEVKTFEHHDGLWVGPADGLGAFFCFHEPAATPF